jgi:hypothetical protein
MLNGGMVLAREEAHDVEAICPAGAHRRSNPELLLVTGRVQLGTDLRPTGSQDGTLPAEADVSLLVARLGELTAHSGSARTSSWSAHDWSLVAQRVASKLLNLEEA